MEIRIEPFNEQYADYIFLKEAQEEIICYDDDNERIDFDTFINDAENDFFVAKINEKIVGFIEASFDEEEMMRMTCALLPSFRGRGLGFDFLQTVLEYLIEHYEYAGRTIRTVIPPDDERSISAFQRVGFHESDESKDWIEMEIEI
jgi:ribosomal protein S18 acetylase RimI-like enzyme